MEKVIVEIVVPATGKTHDFEMPVESNVRDALLEMVQILQDFNGNCVLDSSQAQLCDLDRKLILQEEMTLLEAGIRDGSRLMLV